VTTGALPWSQACENNKGPILEVLRRHLGTARRVLEIGSGTGQHAVHFAAGLPHLVWQPSDLAENLPGIRAWCAERPSRNLEAPVVLDVRREPWPALDADAAFSANTAHIMDWPAVQAMLRGVAALLPPGGAFLLYGPFRYGAAHTSAGNARFDQSLRAAGTGMGIRDAREVEALARALRLEPVADEPMPANNRTLVFRAP